nr:hypothetical protein Iba_chr14aCG4000 [Ipomoea batatas]GMD89546.1 hypothetical protein Iba_chr14dCG1070 [Ipomoea batatas]
MPFRSKSISLLPDGLSEITTRPTAPTSPLKSMESPSHSTITFNLCTFSGSNKGSLEYETCVPLCFSGISSSRTSTLALFSASSFVVFSTFCFFFGV